MFFCFFFHCSALFPSPKTPLTITLKQFISDHKRRNRNGKRKLSDPYDYDWDAYNAPYDSVYDYYLRFTLGSNAPYDSITITMTALRCYDASVNQAKL